MELVRNIFFNTDKLMQNSKVKISYTGKFFEANAEEVFIHYGFGQNWDNLNEIKMEKTELGFQTELTLLEDDTFNSFDVSKVIREAGAKEILTANNLADGIKFVEENLDLVDLVITDMYYPKISGGIEEKSGGYALRGGLDRLGAGSLRSDGCLSPHMLHV